MTAIKNLYSVEGGIGVLLLDGIESGATTNVGN